MRLGLIARCDTTGLGVMTTEFFANMRPDVTVLLDFSALARTEDLEPRWAPNFSLVERYWRSDGVHVVMPERFPRLDVERPPLKIWEALEELLTCDVIYSAETFYWWWLVAEANRRGVRTVLHFMPEYLDYLTRPDLPMVSQLWAPTSWYFNTVERAGLRPILMRVPVSDTIRPRTIDRVERIAHIGGNLMAEDRNGTKLFLESLPHLAKGIEVDVYARFPAAGQRPAPLDYRDLYAEADALVLPRRFGGLCLPLQEAFAAGLPVFMSDMSPQDEILHPYGKLAVRQWGTLRTRTVIETGAVDPMEMAVRLNAVHAYPEWAEDMAEHARTAGMVLRWVNWAGLYRRALEALA